MTASSLLSAGEPAPWFSAASASNRASAVMFDEFAGRHIVLFFFGTASRPDVAEVLASFSRRNDLFDDQLALFIGVSNDPDDIHGGRLREQHPAQRFLFDPGGTATRLYVSADAVQQGAATIGPVAFILSPTLQIIEIVPLTEPVAFVDRIASRLNELLVDPTQVLNAPVLVVPQIFDRAFCNQLIELYDASGGREIGSIESAGKVVEQFDPNFRKRLDWHISDEAALQRTRELLERRLLPMVYRAFQFRTTRIERYLVGCYDATTGGYFRPHRDNTAPVVAHRRFAVTINLNEGYEGGCLSFPEFGHQSFRTAPGDAIVFSCSLLHEVTAVTRDRRYAFISFFYDEASQQMRDDYRKKWMEAQKAGGAGA